METLVKGIDFLSKWRSKEIERDSSSYEECLKVLNFCSTLRGRFESPELGWHLRPVDMPIVGVGQPRVYASGLKPYAFQVANFQAAMANGSLRFGDEVYWAVIRAQFRSHPESARSPTVFTEDNDFLKELCLLGHWNRESDTSRAGRGILPFKKDQLYLEWKDLISDISPKRKPDGSIVRPKVIRRCQVVIEPDEISYSDLSGGIATFQTAVLCAVRLTSVEGNCVIRLPAIPLNLSSRGYVDQILGLFSILGEAFEEVSPYVACSENVYSPRLCIFLRRRLPEESPWVRHLELALYHYSQSTNKEAYYIFFDGISNHHDLSRMLTQWNASLARISAIAATRKYPKFPDLQVLDDYCNCSICMNALKVETRPTESPEMSAWKVYCREARACYMAHVLSSCDESAYTWMVCCGAAGSLKHCERDRHIIGFDIDPGAVEKFNEKAKELDMPNARAYRVDLNCPTMFKLWMRTYPPSSVDILWGVQFMEPFVLRLIEHNRSLTKPIWIGGSFLSPRARVAEFSIEDQLELSYKCYEKTVLVNVPSFHSKPFAEPVVSSAILYSPNLQLIRMDKLFPCPKELSKIASEYVFLFSDMRMDNHRFLHFQFKPRLPPRRYRNVNNRPNGMFDYDPSSDCHLPVPVWYREVQQAVSCAEIVDVHDPQALLWFPNTWYWANRRRIRGSSVIHVSYHRYRKKVYDKVPFD